MEPNASAPHSYWSRQFKKHMERKRASRMSVIPQIPVPHIFVDGDPSESSSGAERSQLTDPIRWTNLTPGEGAWQRAAQGPTDLSLHDTAYQHPLSYPRSSSDITTRQESTSGFSFELDESDGQVADAIAGSRRGSATTPTEARGMLDDSVWMESIRRSATLRRPEKGSYRYGDIG